MGLKKILTTITSVLSGDIVLIKRGIKSLEVTFANLQASITALGTITATKVTGQHCHTTQSLTATAEISIDSGIVMLAHNSTIIAATLDAPTAGDELFIINTSASGTAAHTVTLPSGVTWDGTNRVATLNAPGEALHVVATSATSFFIMENIGSVAFS